VLSGGGHYYYWYENDGSGVFGPPQLIGGGWYPQSIYAADLDGDGDADVLGADGSMLRWYENDGNGVFGPSQDLREQFSQSYDFTSVYAADLDGDGDADVLSASSNFAIDDEVAWYENEGSGVFGSQQVITTAVKKPLSVYAIDLDGDGDADVLSASMGVSARGQDKIAWYENEGSGMFGSQQVITTAAEDACSVYATDLDGDGDADVLSASSWDNKIAWYENDGSGVFGPQQVIAIAQDTQSVYAVDLDGDGDADVLSASWVGNEIAWYENDGSGVFGAPQVISNEPSFSLYTSVYAADLDGDGDADVLSAARGLDYIAWYENLMGPSDCNGNSIPDSDDIASGTSSDCNSDGTPDECEIASDSALDQNTNGILDSCECITSNYCVSAGNSAGTVCTIGWQGTHSITSNDFTLTASGAPPLKFGLFFYGATQTQIILGEGMLCIAPPIQRLQPILVTDAQGAASLSIDFTQEPVSSGPFAMTPFSTWNFQFWHRDPSGGPAGFNFSDGLEVTFCP
jgi:hypothetical protein